MDSRDKEVRFAGLVNWLDDAGGVRILGFEEGE